MSAAQPRTDRVQIHVTYGLGGSCSASVPRGQIEGRSVRSLIGRVIRGRRRPEPEACTAAALAEVLRSGREIDPEVVDWSRGEAEGIPIALDEPLLRSRSDERGSPARNLTDEDEIAIRISESYRGGA